MVKVLECECGRNFIPLDVYKACHCRPSCCLQRGCVNAKPRKKRIRTPEDGFVAPNDPEFERKCVACGRHARDFVKFAPCSDNCKGGYWNLSSKETPDYPARFLQRACHLVSEREGEEGPRLHFPVDPPRIHIKYCSLTCYNSPMFGHEVSERQGRRTRNRRYLNAVRNNRDESAFFGSGMQRFNKQWNELMHPSERPE